MRITVADVLRRPESPLAVLVEGAPGALDAPVLWVLSSDLSDPTPFLGRGHLLLTTGGQFGPGAASPANLDAYVERLQRAGVPAVGFGVRVVHPQVPAALVEACRRHGLPLFQVPYQVPFIAVIRHAAELIDAAGHRRGSWALAAARAVSLAALRPEPLEAVLGELYRRLERAVVLLDARGRTVVSRGVVPAEVAQVARTEAAAILARGRRSSATVTVRRPAPEPSTLLTMQTVGRDGELRGVLVLGGDHGLDAADQTVVTTAVALAGLAMEHGREAQRLRGWLRTAAWRALAAGDIAMVRRAARAAGVRLPAEPVRVVVWLGEEGADDLITALENACDDGAAVVFAKSAPGEVVACAGAERCLPLVRSQATKLGAGVSEPVGFASLTAGTERARRMARRAAPGGVVVLDELGAEGGLATLLSGPDAGDIARANLRALTDHDAAHSTALLAAVAYWLAVNGNAEAAARRAGLHRHTLRDRIVRAGVVLGRDLDDPDVRADLWLSLRTARLVPAGAV